MGFKEFVNKDHGGGGDKIVAFKSLDVLDHKSVNFLQRPAFLCLNEP